MNFSNNIFTLIYPNLMIILYPYVKFNENYQKFIEFSDLFEYAY